MRPRSIIFIFGGVVLLNIVIALGAFFWTNSKTKTTLSQTPTNSVNATLPVPNASGAWAEFDSPREGDAVDRRFPVSGRCGALPAGSRLMLVVDSGREVYSPKFPLLLVEGDKWSGTGNEFGAPRGGTFFLCVFAVSEEGVEKITEWHTQGKATSKWPPFRGSVPGGVSLARIQLRVADK
jgi:hypothetical protein